MKAIRIRLSALFVASLMMQAGPVTLSLHQQAARKSNYIPYQDARPILEALSEVAPAELKAAGAADLASVWATWVARRDREIRARLVQGDEDSLINFLLFGTSYTRRPRLTLEALAKAGQQANSPETAAFVEAIKGRAGDLIQGIAMPGHNERLLFARRVAEAKGFDVKTAAGRERLKQYLLAGLARVLGENASYAKILESARLLGNPSEEFAERSKLFRDRGLSSDTSLMPNFAIERALDAMKSAGLIATGSIRRLAIIGPGLDFTDKQDGYDFYPQQTIQPFAAIDTLLRLGLARSGSLQVTTLDLSPRINDHLARSKLAARRGQGYTIQLPRDEQGQWKAEAVAFWEHFGDQIGTPVPPVAIPAGTAGLKVRAVKVRPAVVSLITPQDLNVVLQRIEWPAGEGFDLIIATNILVYYDIFEQSLALANIEKMLRPGGFLLSNNALLELPSSNVHSINYTTVVYSDRPNDGDHIVWYQRNKND